MAIQTFQKAYETDNKPFVLYRSNAISRKALDE